MAALIWSVQANRRLLRLQFPSDCPSEIMTTASAASNVMGVVVVDSLCSSPNQEIWGTFLPLRFPMRHAVSGKKMDAVVETVPLLRCLPSAQLPRAGDLLYLSLFLGFNFPKSKIPRFRRGGDGMSFTARCSPRSWSAESKLRPTSAAAAASFPDEVTTSTELWNGSERVKGWAALMLECDSWKRGGGWRRPCFSTIPCSRFGCSSFA